MLQTVVRKTIVVRGLEIKEKLEGWNYAQVVELLNQRDLSKDEENSSGEVEYYALKKFVYLKHLTVTTKIFFDTTLVVFKQAAQRQKPE